MARDYYAILGVTPASEDVVIRAAYRALMRRYHPDADPSSDASRRAQEINTAYAVLSDPEERARYDGSLAARELIRRDPPPRGAAAKSRLPRPGPAAAIGFAALAAALVAFIAWPPLAEVQAPQVPSPAEQTLPAEPRQVPTAAEDSQRHAERLCGDSAASGLIANELFGSAARRRGSDFEQLQRLAARAIVRIESSASRSSGSGAVECHGFVALDLPPGLVVDEGRTNLNAEVNYAILERPDGSLSLSSLSGADGMVGSLATLAPARREPLPAVEPIAPERIARAEPTAPARPRTAEPPKRERVEKTAERKPAPAPAKATSSTASNSPSFGCGAVTDRAEKLICGSSNLSALDRQAALLYSQSWGKASEAKRADLLGTRADFRDRRNACKSESCLTSAYVARLREISDIMAGRKDP